MIDFTSFTPEELLIGALILDPSNIPRIASEVAYVDFRDPDLGDLFDAMTTLHDAGTPVGDVAVLIPALKRMGLTSEKFCAPRIVKFVSAAFSHHAVFYAKETRKAAALRRYERLGRELERMALANEADPDRIASWLDCAARSSASEGGRCRHIRDITAEIISDLRKPREDRRPVMTGLIDLDETVGGFCPGELVILAARTGQGKTSLATQMAIHAAEHRGPVVYLSLEMAQSEVVTRILCSHADLNSQLLRNRSTSREHIDRIAEAGENLSRFPFYVDDTSTATTKHIRAVCKQVGSRTPLAMAVVDYIGLVRHENMKLPKWERVADVTRDLKAISKDLAIPVLALAQLNREADGLAPKLSHLRDSGSLEQDADVVLFISHDTEAGTAELEVAKHRHAQTGTVSLKWIPERTRFESAAPAAVYCDTDNFTFAGKPATSAKQTATDAKHGAAVAEACERIRDAFRGPDWNPDTKPRIRERSGCSAGKVFNDAWGKMLRTKEIIEADVTRPDADKPIAGYRLMYPEN